jgi:hypothetical protein
MKDIFEGAGKPLDQTGFDDALAQLGGTKEALWAILHVETAGFGFFNDRRPKILFERHVFSRRTARQFDAKAPDISNEKSGGYTVGANEYSRLKRAMLLDRKAALESASWGLGQVMGFNAARVGYSNVDAMIRAFAVDERAQIMGCVKYIESEPALKKAYEDHKWEKVAHFYNGESYAKNGYDKKLEAAYKQFSVAGGCPSVELRAVQAYLSYLGYRPRGVDGIAGPGTTAALGAFRAAYSKPKGGTDLPPINSAFSLYLPFLEAAFEATNR